MPRIAKTAAFLWAAILTSTVANSTETAFESDDLKPENIAQELEEIVPQLLEKHGIPGAGIAISTSKGTLFAGSFGSARPGEAATPKTLFNVASIAKLVASEAILRAVAKQGRSVDEPMATHWVDPDVKDDPRHLDLTLRHALAHQTGFKNWRFLEENQKLAFNFAPGSRPGYSGEGYNYAARFVESLTGTDFPTIVKNTVLRPLHIERLAITNKESLREEFAFSKDKDGRFELTRSDNEWSAADDLFASPQAFAVFMSSMLKANTLPKKLEEDRRSIQFDMTAQFCARPAFKDICPQNIGFGMTGVIFKYENETIYWQGGGDIGERAVAIMIPKRDIAISIFANSASGGALFEPVARTVINNDDFLTFLSIQGSQ